MELNDKNNRSMVDRCIDALKELDPTVADMLEVAQQNVEAMLEYHKHVRNEARADAGALQISFGKLLLQPGYRNPASKLL